MLASVQPSAQSAGPAASAPQSDCETCGIRVLCTCPGSCWDPSLAGAGSARLLPALHLSQSPPPLPSPPTPPPPPSNQFPDEFDCETCGFSVLLCTSTCSLDPSLAGAGSATSAPVLHLSQSPPPPPPSNQFLVPDSDQEFVEKSMLCPDFAHGKVRKITAKTAVLVKEVCLPQCI